MATSITTRATELHTTGIDSLVREIAAAPSLDLWKLPGIGDVLDDLELIERLGEGGMGVVYRAREHSLGRDVAVKVVRPALWAAAGARGTAALEREAQATARLAHPAIVTVYRVGRAGDTLYIVLELLRGETLAARLVRGRVDAALAIRWCVDLASGLAHAHGAGIIHRDLKPGNVFVVVDDRIKLLDFGLAGVDAGGDLSPIDPIARSESSSRRSFSLAGTPAYMAPEQERGAAGDAASDVWALGATLFELVAGRHPRDVTAPAAVLRDRAPDLPPPLAAAIVDMLADEPARRPTAAQVVARLGPAGLGAVGARAVLPVALLRRKQARTALIGSLVVLALCAAGAAALWARRAAGPPRTRPAEGRWLADPLEGSTWEAQIRHLPSGEVEWLYVDHGPPGLERAAHRAVLRPARHADGNVLEGKAVDLPGYCCGNVGYVRFEVVDEHHLEQEVALFGPPDGGESTSFPAWSYRWVGPLEY